MIKNRKPLRKKECKNIRQHFADSWGIKLDDGLMECGKIDDVSVILNNKVPIAIKYNNKIVPTLNLIMAKMIRKNYVTVDMGAVPHISNGADVMAPGIVEIHSRFEVGDVLWVRDVRNKMPIAVGVALISSSEISAKGKVIKVVHHVGDKVWKELKRVLG